MQVPRNAGTARATQVRADVGAVGCVRVLDGSQRACLRAAEREFTLAEGDCVMVMSDGFPEMFNEADETLDYGRAEVELAGVA